MKKTKLINLLLLVVLLKGIVWSLLIPLWHFPDEQAHFGHIAFLVESPIKNLGKVKDLTEEIAISEKFLGVFRDEKGNNKYTYQPEYNLEYSDTYTGIHESEIKSLPQETRTNFVAKESAYYPHFYYRVSGLIYKLFYNSNLFIRVFTIRLFWLFIYSSTVYLSFLTAKLIFPKKSQLASVVAIMVGFQPMFNFVSSGITSDNLHNFFFTAVIYFSVKLLTKLTLFDWFGLLVALGLGLVNKQQFMVAFIVVLPIFISLLLKQTKKILRFFLLLPVFILLPLLVDYNYTQDILKHFLQGKIPFLALSKSKTPLLPDYSLYQHFVWTIKHTIREVVPWYWGVFRWLSLVLPAWVNRVINRLMIISAIGLMIKLVNVIKRKKLNLQNKLLGFIIYTAVIYFLCLFIWDWNYFRNHNFSFGIQGRYYFPTLLPHLILLGLGISELFSLISTKLEKFSLWLLSLGFIGLNSIALYTLVNSYYDLSSYQSFIIQASQYKPFFAKGAWLTIFLSLYLSSLILLVYKLTKTFNEK